MKKHLSKRISSDLALGKIVTIARHFFTLSKNVSRVALFTNTSALVADFQAAADWIAVGEALA